MYKFPLLQEFLTNNIAKHYLHVLNLNRYVIIKKHASKQSTSILASAKITSIIYFDMLQIFNML